MSFLDLISFLSLCSWIYIVFFHGRKNFIKDKFFWSNSIIFEDNIIKTKISNKKICVIIPARNEERNILKKHYNLLKIKIFRHFIP